MLAGAKHYNEFKDASRRISSFSHSFLLPIRCCVPPQHYNEFKDKTNFTLRPFVPSPNSLLCPAHNTTNSSTLRHEFHPAPIRSFPKFVVVLADEDEVEEAEDSDDGAEEGGKGYGIHRAATLSALTYPREARLRRLSSKLPSHLILPRRRRILVWAFTLISKCKPASTTAFLVVRPVAFIASWINSSSIAIVVRITSTHTTYSC
mgnify:CR=1 FL=1